MALVMCLGTDCLDSDSCTLLRLRGLRICRCSSVLKLAFVCVVSVRFSVVQLRPEQCVALVVLVGMVVIVVNDV